MRKNIFAIIAGLALLAAACTKEDNIRPIFDTPDTPTLPTVDLTQLVGNWAPDNHAAYKIYLYSRTDGTLIDSIISDLSENGFNFYADGNADTPWDLSATYTADTNKITFNIMGIFERNYNLLKLDSTSLIMERTDTSDYYLNDESGNISDTLMGIEIEHWSLTRTR